MILKQTNKKICSKSFLAWGYSGKRFTQGVHYQVTQPICKQYSWVIDRFENFRVLLHANTLKKQFLQQRGHFFFPQRIFGSAMNVNSLLTTGEMFMRGKINENNYTWHLPVLSIIGKRNKMAIYFHWQSIRFIVSSLKVIAWITV